MRRCFSSLRPGGLANVAKVSAQSLSNGSCGNHELIVRQDDGNADASFKDCLKRFVVTDVSSSIRFEPFVRINVVPADFVPRVDDQLFKLDALGTAVALVKGMHDVEIAEGFGDMSDELVTAATFKPPVLLHRKKQLCRFGTNSFCRAKASVEFAEVYRTRFTCPRVDVGQQMAMDDLKECQIVRRGTIQPSRRWRRSGLSLHPRGPARLADPKKS